MGHRAAAAACPGPVAEGNVGAGTGASVGKLHGIARATKGGLGCVVLERDGVHLGALMAVNAVGDVRDPDTGRLIAGARDAADGRRLIDTAAALAAGARPPAFRPVNTTIGLVATTASLDKVAAARVARLAMDGFTRALSPPHLTTDGDALFCLSVGSAHADVDTLGGEAADLVARAIARAVRAAVAAGGLPASRDLD